MHDISGVDAALDLTVSEEGNVTCPWHAWRFCVRDGKWADNPRLSVDKFDVRVVGDDIQVAVAK